MQLLGTSITKVTDLTLSIYRELIPYQPTLPKSYMYDVILKMKFPTLYNGIDIETINNLYTKSTLKTSDIKTSNESNSRTSCEPTRTTESRIQVEPVKKGFFAKVKEFFS